MAAPKTFSIRTFGCQMNEHDSERLAGLLVADGLVRATSDDEVADVVVLNTCTIRENADLKLYSALGHLKALERAASRHADRGGRLHGPKGPRRNPTARKLGRRRLWHSQPGRGTDFCCEERAAKGHSPRSSTRPIPKPTVTWHPPSTPCVRAAFAAWITIQTGCDNTCAYCIVPSVRGREISRPMQDVIDEATMLASSGVVELTVLGQNVNSYGRDITKRGPAVRRPVARPGRSDGIERIRFTSPHPKDLRPETIAAMAETKAVCPQLHLPLQHGAESGPCRDASRLQLERYLERLASAREAIFDLAVTTDLIVGFPGETERRVRGVARGGERRAVRLGLHVHLLRSRRHARRTDDRTVRC